MLAYIYENLICATDYSMIESEREKKKRHKSLNVWIQHIALNNAGFLVQKHARYAGMWAIIVNHFYTFTTGNILVPKAIINATPHRYPLT